MIVLTFTGLNLILSGCSNPKDANEGNFKQAINAILAKEKVGCVSVLGYAWDSFPAGVPKESTEQINLLNSLVKVGLLSSKEATVKHFLSRKSVPGIEYSVTPEGQKFYTPNVYQQPSGGFCIGEAEVDKIINFTPPQSYPGSPQISLVKFTYKFKNIGKWVKDPEVQATIGTWSKNSSPGGLVNGNGGLNQILESKDNPPEREIRLFLTNNGWVDKL